MKKFVLLILGIVFITGCSNNKEQELCNKIDGIDVLSYTSIENYEELTTILEKNYQTYCNGVESEVCKKLNEYINTTKSEVKIEDCSVKDGAWKDLCESDNKLAINTKQINVNYMKEEVWAICNQ